MWVREVLVVTDADGEGARDTVALHDDGCVRDREDHDGESDGLQESSSVNELEHEEVGVVDGDGVGDKLLVTDNVEEAVGCKVSDPDGLYDGMRVNDADTVEEHVAEEDKDSETLKLRDALMGCEGVSVCDLEIPDGDKDVEAVRVGTGVGELVVVADTDDVRDRGLVGLSDALDVRDREESVSEGDARGDRLPVNDKDVDRERVADEGGDDEGLPVGDANRDVVADTVPECEGLPERLMESEADAVARHVLEAEQDREAVALWAALMEPDGLPVLDAEARDCDPDVEEVRDGRCVDELLVVVDAEGVGDADQATLCDRLHVCVHDDSVTEFEGVVAPLLVTDTDGMADRVGDAEFVEDAVWLRDPGRDRVEDRDHEREGGDEALHVMEAESV